MKGFHIRFLLGLATLLLALLTGCSTPGAAQGGDLPTSSDQTEVQKRASIRLQLAIGYYEQRQWKVALDEIKQALAIYPNYADAYCIRALIYMEMGENKLAEDNFRQALKLSPNNPDYSNNYGWFLCQNGRERESIAYFESALANRYQSPEKAFNNAGICSLRMQQEHEALRYFMRAFQLDSANPLTNAYLSKIFAERHDEERARFYLNRVSKADFIPAQALLVSIQVARTLKDRTTEVSLATQLRRRFPDSPEYAAYKREVLHD